MSSTAQPFEHVPGTFPFLLLSRELRDMVYAACIPPGKRFTIRKYLNLLLTCRMIREECIPIFDNSYQAFPDIDTLYTYLIHIGPAGRAKLRRVAFMYSRRPGKPIVPRFIDDIEDCFKLLRNECPSLTHLTVWIYAGVAEWFFEYPQQETDIRKATRGIEILAELRGLKEARLLPDSAAPQFSPKVQELAGLLERRLMQPKDQKHVLCEAAKENYMQGSLSQMQ